MLCDNIGEVIDKGVGHFCWDEGKDGKLMLILATPVNHRLSGFELAILYMERIKGNWAKPGDIVGWDGNKEFPTLSPSIKVGGWYGFLVKGKLSDKAPENFIPYK